MALSPLRYLLRQERLALIIAQHHLCQEGFAAELELSRQYWSELWNRHRPLSPKIRRALLQNERLKGIAESELWDVLPAASEELHCAAK